MNREWTLIHANSGEEAKMPEPVKYHVGAFPPGEIEWAHENQSRAEAIRTLYDDTVRRIADLTRSQYAVHAADFLFKRPMFKASDFYKNPTMTPPSARKILKTLSENGFFHELRPASGRRSAVLAYRQLMNTAEGREVF